MLGFLVKLTDAPERIVPYDLASLREWGMTSRAIIDATYVCVGFNIINRIADAMDFQLPPTSVFVKGSWFMRRFGYRLMSGSWSTTNSSHIRSHADLSPQSDRSMLDPHDDLMRRLMDSVFSGPGTLDSAVRQAVGSGDQISGALGQYVTKIWRRDYQNIDKCIVELRSGGYSDDQIFEATVSAALGAGVSRLHLVIKVLRQSLASQAA